MRLIDADTLSRAMYHEAFETDSDWQRWDSGLWIRYKMFENALKSAPAIDAVPVVRCGECKHRPIKEDINGADYGFNLIGPNDGDELCPCLVEDGWYSWMPQDNFFCAYGERRADDLR